MALRGIVVCFPCLVWIPCLPWGRIVQLDIGIACNGTIVDGVRATVEDSRGCGLSCVTPLQGASSCVKVAICVE